MDTLAVQLTVPSIRPVKDLHLQVSAPCRAHKKKTSATYIVTEAYVTPNVGVPDRTPVESPKGIQFNYL
jgi:hypothetical protein